MKKLAAITLIAVLFFNWYGYRLVTNYWQQQASRRLESRINNNDFSEDNLVPIKFPIATQSYAKSTEWERIDGEVIIADVAYKYVKRRIIGDSLELLCIRNTERMELDKAGNEFFGKVNNFPNSKPSPQKDAQKLFSPVDLSAKLINRDPIQTTQTIQLTPATLPGHSSRAERPPIAA